MMHKDEGEDDDDDDDDDDEKSNQIHLEIIEIMSTLKACLLAPFPSHSGGQ